MLHSYSPAPSPSLELRELQDHTSLIEEPTLLQHSWNIPEHTNIYHGSIMKYHPEYISPPFLLRGGPEAENHQISLYSYCEKHLFVRYIITVSNYKTQNHSHKGKGRFQPCR